MEARWSGTPAHSPPPLFISVVSAVRAIAPTPPWGAATTPSLLPTASSCIFDKVIGIFLLTGFSLHFTCPSLGLTVGCQAGAQQDSYPILFILSADFPAVEGDAEFRRGTGAEQEVPGPRWSGTGKGAFEGGMGRTAAPAAPQAPSTPSCGCVHATQTLPDPPVDPPQPCPRAPSLHTWSLLFK